MHILEEILIETPRLKLRSMQADELDAIHLIFSDPKVMAAFHEPPFTREQTRAWMQRNLDHQTKHGFGLFTVLLKADDQLIGDCGLEVMEVDGAQAAELGYDFRSDFWGQGYATEAARAVRDYAFNELHLSRLISLIRVGNVASRRVAEKVGMHYLSEIVNGPRHYWQYGLSAERWPKQEPS
jgi:RimJ/RimL family protein N-acetyltransferase